MCTGFQSSGTGWYEYPLSSEPPLSVHTTIMGHRPLEAGKHMLPHGGQISARLTANPRCSCSVQGGWQPRLESCRPWRSRAERGKPLPSVRSQQRQAQEVKRTRGTGGSWYGAGVTHAGSGRTGHGGREGLPRSRAHSGHTEGTWGFWTRHTGCGEGTTADRGPRRPAQEQRASTSYLMGARPPTNTWKPCEEGDVVTGATSPPQRIRNWPVC